MSETAPKNYFLHLILLPVIALPVLVIVFLFVRGDEAEQLYARALERAAEGDYPAAFAAFKRAGELGHAEAYCNLGLFYLHGVGREASPELGRDYLELAALNGSIQADYELGVVAERAETPDFETAALHYRRAALAGHIGGLKAIARLHLAGEGTNRSPLLAAEFLRKAAAAGDPEAMTSLGELLLSGDLDEPDYQTAQSLFKRAAEEEFPAAYTGLGYLAEQEYVNHVADWNAAEKFYSKAAQLGDMAGMVNLGDLMKRTGRTEEALLLYQAAAKRQFAPACQRLGMMALEGAQPDYAKARELFQTAGKLGSAVGYLNYGILCETGRGGEVNLEAARQAYQNAQKLGAPEAQERLAELDKKL